MTRNPADPPALRGGTHPRLTLAPNFG